MTKRFPLYLIAGILALCFTAACNDDPSETTILEGDYNNCAISTFSLAKDDSILRALDSVYFSIDLIDAKIYNADSLPKGTDITKFIVNVTAPAASAIELSFKSRFTGNDTTVNITENPGDSINFAAGPVKMTVTSYNGQTKRDYDISVRVHTMDADTLYWDRLQQVSFPKAASAQKTVMYGSGPHTLLAGTDGKHYLCTTDSPEAYDAWHTAVSSLPSGADISTFSATDNALYIATADGALYSAADGLTWTPTGARMHCLYGGYGSTLLGARRDSDGWKHVTWPATTERAVPADCPVSGTSQLIIYQTKWSTSDLAIMVGGKDSSGRYSGETWAYDGSRWDRISSTGIDEREGVALFPYSTPRLSSDSWKVTEQSALLAMGGQYETDKGIEASNTVYISYDFGITWKEADSYLQFPKDYPDFSAAQAYVIDYTLHARSTFGNGAWRDLTPRTIPCWATPAANVDDIRSRVSKPVTSWECPYIFLFGGKKADGTLQPHVTRGVINRFTFQPLY